MKKPQFTNEQLNVINDTLPFATLYDTLLQIGADEFIDLKQKRFLMFREIVNYMKVRKGNLLFVGIKDKIADKIIRDEFKTLEQISKEIKNVIS